MAEIVEIRGNNTAFMDSLEREFRLGLELEKVHYGMRQAAINAEWDGVELRDPGGTMRLDGVIDARTYFRWQQEDPDFWKDESNWRRMKQDSPELAVKHQKRRNKVGYGD